MVYIPRCCMRPAMVRAVSPVPQNTSPRTAPRMAPPVSCATIRRRMGTLLVSEAPLGSGRRACTHSGAPYGINCGSTASEWPGVNGTPCAPTGPRLGSSVPRERKKTYDGFWYIKLSRRSGWAAIHARMACIDISSRDTSPISMRSRPIARYGWPFSPS